MAAVSCYLSQNTVYFWKEADTMERIVEKMEQFKLSFLAFWDQFLKFLPNILSALIILALAWLATKLINAPVNTLMKRIKIDIDQVAIKYVNRVIKILIWFLGIVMAMDKLGIPVTSLITMLAAIGAAVALAIKDNLSNLASGVVLLFTKPFKAGDYIEVESFSGTIKEIEIMHSYLVTPGNTLVAIPNTKMMTATIVNYSAYETRRQDFLFSIGYDDDLLEAKAVLQNLLDQHPLILKDPAPAVLVDAQGESAVTLLARVWCQNSEYWNLRYDLVEKVKLAFDEHGITIPYNQLDVHFPEPRKDSGEAVPSFQERK